MPILPMITLLLEFLIVSCVLCVPQVDSSLYQIKHCLSLVLYGKYITRLETKSVFVSHPLFSCYISRIALAAVLYLVHIYVCLANITKQRSETKKSNYTREVINTCSYTSGRFMSTGIAAGVDDLLYQPSNLGHK